jgi:hypothetical protein
MSALATELNALFDVQARVQSLSQMALADSKRTLIDIRKDLTHCISRIHGLVADHAILAARPSVDSEFRGRLSKVRTVIALHQAEWPAVELDSRPDDYFRSAGHVTATIRDFIHWAKGAVA